MGYHHWAHWDEHQRSTPIFARVSILVLFDTILVNFDDRVKTSLAGWLTVDENQNESETEITDHLLNTEPMRYA